MGGHGDMLEGFEWSNYFCLAIVYTMFAFGNLTKGGRFIFFTEDGRFTFFKRSSRPFLEILMIHSVFLTVLLWLMQLGDYVEPALPQWLTNTFSWHSETSILDLLFLAIILVMVIIERRWLYVEADIGSTEPED